MSYLRNIEKVVSSQLFSKPNNIFLQAKHRPVYIETSQEPTIQHLHSVKSLLRTIQILKANTDARYKQIIDAELSILQDYRSKYSERVASYVGKGGLLTGQGIANVYYSAEELGYSQAWLQQNVHHQIPNKYKYMSTTNIQDLLQTLPLFHPQSPYLTLLQTQLGTRSQEPWVYVEHQQNQNSKYEYIEGNPSNNPLVRILENSSSPFGFHFVSLWSKVCHRGRYALHNE